MATSACRTSGDTWSFSVFAPLHDSMALRIVFPEKIDLRMAKDASGYFRVDYVSEEEYIDYFYIMDGKRVLPDPASRWQPEGSHSFSRTLDASRLPSSNVASYRRQPVDRYIIYEVHVGTFSRDGTFDGFIRSIPYLKDLGITAVELMPIGQFPGERNWGYDGTFPFAVQNSYGGPLEFKRMIDECHRAGIAVILDVVYNHFGPEGNYFWHFGPYFTDKYKTPWGSAINFDSSWSDQVRDLFVENALYWFRYFDIDALRLDAVHAMFDSSPRHILAEIHEEVKNLERELGRPCILIAESDLNDTKVLDPPEARGFGFDCQWLDDFHHSLHSILTGESHGFYQGFGTVDAMLKSLNEGFVHSGHWCEFRKRNYGTTSKGIDCRRFIAFVQNHDMAGNRVRGERFHQLTDFDRAKLAAGICLLSPYIPFLFMGEEYAEDHPFCYFASHSDRELVRQVREGRKEELRNNFNFDKRYIHGIDGTGPGGGDVEPFDPFDPATYEISKLSGGSGAEDLHRSMLLLYRDLISLRKGAGIFDSIGRGDFRARKIGRSAILTHLRDSLMVLYNLGGEPERHELGLSRDWLCSMRSDEDRYGGLIERRVSTGESASGITLPAYSFCVFGKRRDPAPGSPS